MMAQYTAAGLDEFALPDFNLGVVGRAARDAIERFHEEVVSQVADVRQG